MRRATVTLLGLLLSAAQFGAQAQALSLGAFLLALENVKSALQSTVGTVDAETAARIAQAEIAVDGAILKLREAMSEGIAKTDNLRDRAMGDAFTALAKTNELVQGATTNIFENVNNSLVNSYKAAAALPLAGDIPASIVAVRPYSIVKEGKDTPVTVQVQGYFPDISKAHPAYVTVAGGPRKPLQPFVNNTLEFDLAASELPPEEQFVRMQIVLPVKRWLGLFYDESVFNAKVYVRRAKPFDVSYSVQTENPAIWSTVTAPRPLTVFANSERTSATADVTAASLFSTLVGDNKTYDMSTAKLVGWAMDQRSAIVDGISPCASGCVASTGSWSWTEDKLSYSLNAPTCPMHVINPSGFFEAPYQCGGGTHADFANTPTFKVRNRSDAPPELTVTSGQLNMAPAAAAVLTTLPVAWSSVDISVSYRDGSVRSQTSTRLKSGAAGKPNHNAPAWAAEVSGGRLNVMTR